MKSFYFYLILFLISIVDHMYWFIPNTILTFGDWYYWPIGALKQLYYSWGTWINYVGFGNLNVQISFNFFMSFWSIMANLGLGYDVSSKLTFFIPIAILSFLAPYILSKKITNNDYIAFIVALFYGTTTVVLINQLPIQVVYVLSPLILYFFIFALEKNKLIYWLELVLIYCISIFYEVRITYIVTWILIFYFLFIYGLSLKKYLKNLIVSGILIMGLNLFWILPTILGGITKTIGSIISRSLFGSQLFDISHAITIFNWLWTGGKPNNSFVVQPVIWYFWLFPILAFSSFLFLNIFNKSEKKQLLFYGFISLLGILLSKESSIPFSGLYAWLYFNFPGFSLFRESSKLFLFTAIGYMGLISYFFLGLLRSNLKFKKPMLFTFIFLISFASLWNAKPLITGEVGQLFTPRYIPSDYLRVKNNILKQSTYFRTLWVPTYSRWSFFDNSNPILGMSNLINFDSQSFFAEFSKGIYNSEGKKYTNFLDQKYIHKFLDMSSVKYVSIPLEDKVNDDDFFANYGEQRQFYINALNKISWLKKINIGTKKIAVYENPSFRPHIYTTFDKETIIKNVPYKKIQYSFINPTQYSLVLSHIKKPLYVNFSEHYNFNWRMRVGNFNWFSVLTNKNYFMPKNWHFQNDATLNSFYVDPRIVCKIDNCIKNSDGTYTIYATLYFTPQSYMYLGLIISGTTLISILGYLGFIGILSLKNKYEKRK